MKYFEKFVSNTYAGSSNQLYFTLPSGVVKTGRVFYKISVGGEYNYSLLFSNIIDSTHSVGAVSHKNMICDEWHIHKARIGRCKDIPSGKPMSELTMSDGDGQTDITVFDLRDISFDGEVEKRVAPGEFFSSDPVLMYFDKGDYLCLELSFSGGMIPYHEESLLPIYVMENGKWVYSKCMPLAGMVGCDRKVKARIGFWGDSITQGIGTALNSYKHWNAVLSEKLGDGFSYWNLGIGYGRANDGASLGAWYYKIKQNDIIVVCFGVNDIFRGFTEEGIKADLLKIVETLKKDGKTVILQAIPPYGYTDEKRPMWERINEFIKSELGEKADLVFDVSPFIGREDMPSEAKYGGHPNEEGCRIWAEALYSEIAPMLKKIH